MTRPICSLCHRVGAECVYPQRKNTHRQRRTNQARRQSHLDTTGNEITGSPKSQVGSASGERGERGEPSTAAERKTPEGGRSNIGQEHQSPSGHRLAEATELSASPVDIMFPGAWNDHALDPALHSVSHEMPDGGTVPIFDPHIVDPPTSFSAYSPGDDPDSAMIWEALIEDLSHDGISRGQEVSFPIHPVTGTAEDNYSKQTWVDVDMDLANHL